MIEINLLPEEYRPHRTRPQPIFSMVVTLSALLLLLIFALNMLAHIRIKHQWSLATENLKAIRVTNEETKSVLNRLDTTLRPEVKAIRAILSNEINWAQILSLLVRRLPKNVWLAKLEMNDEPQGWTLTLNGFARPGLRVSSISAVGEFTTMLKSDIEQLLAEEDIHANIELLTTTKRKRADRVEIVEFKASFVRNR